MNIPNWFRKMWRISTMDKPEGSDKIKARLFSVFIVVLIFLTKFIYDEFLNKQRSTSLAFLTKSTFLTLMV